MPIKPEDIRRRLMQEKYAEVVVTDLERFQHCARNTPSGRASVERVKEWAKSGVAYQPMLLSPSIAGPNQFINCTREMNKKNPRLSECSNFAYHAIGVLLDDPKIRAEYNIAVVGTMKGLHNIAVMVPIGETIPPNGPLPKGSLIVDPWAVGMGHDPKHALAVPPEEFAYKNSLYDKFKVHWQSSDPKHAKALSELPEQNTLKAYSGETQVVKQQPPKSYTEYTQLWNDTFKQIQHDPKFEAIRGNTDQQKIQAIKTVLNDYTKGGDNFWGAIKRFFTGHWNRHHVSDVDKIVKKIDSGGFANSADLVREIDSIAKDPSKKVNPTGDFKQRLDFITEKNKESGQEQVQDARTQFNI